MVSFCSPWKSLFNGHLVFDIQIFPYKAKADPSVKVVMSQIQQPPYNSVPWKGRNFLAKKHKNPGWSHFVALENLFPTVIWFLILKFFLTKL